MPTLLSWSDWVARPEHEQAEAARGRRRRRPATTAAAPPADTANPLRRLLGDHASPVPLGLWLVEVILCAVLFYTLLTVADADPALRLCAANQAVVLALTCGLTSVAVGLYSADTYLNRRVLLLTSAAGALLALPAIWLVGSCLGVNAATLFGGHVPLTVASLLAGTALLFVLRFAFSYAVRANLFVRHLLIVGEDASAERVGVAINSVRGGVFKVAAIVPAGDPTSITADYLRQRKVWAVVTTEAGDRDATATARMLDAKGQHVRSYSGREFWERCLRRVDVDQPGPEWRQGGGSGAAGSTELDGGGRRPAPLPRLGDIVLSLTLLAATLPLMLITALAIACESRGRVLYRQERVGLHGRVFTLLKFRSMRQDAEAQGPVWAMQRDPRVSRVGSFIRRTRIDELPQLLNVLRGEMSFIGPRPERPHFVEQLERVVPFYHDRALVKPGLTGWAQVNYPYGASVEDARAKLSYDLYYVKYRSLLLDLLILVATVRVVLFQRGAR
jgi:exopolysaccharide biosynthesis polyprenyl glycosylphosphotransferase